MTAKKKTSKDTTIEKLCFVVGPIGDEGSETRIKANWLLKGIIKPVLEARGYTAERSDEVTVPGNIDTQMINKVIDAELVIADLSELNANAFYELGLRHASGLKPVIHMMRKGERIPFDNTTFRTIVFDHESFEGMEEAKIALEAQLDEIEKDGFKVETPVSRARAVEKINIGGTDNEKTLQIQIDQLRRQISDLADTSIIEDMYFDEKSGYIRPKTLSEMAQDQKEQWSDEDIKRFRNLFTNSIHGMKF